MLNPPTRTLIASPRNPRIMQVRKLASRKERSRSGLFFAEGIRLVAEAIRSGSEIAALIVAPELLTSDFAHDLLARQVRRDVPRLGVTAAVMQRLTTREHPQGLAAVVRQRWHSLAAVRPGDELCWVALDAPQDPGNVGTILRTLDAVGGAGLILLGDATDPYHPAAVRASMGAICTQRLVRTTFAALCAWQQAHGYRLVGTAVNATRDYDAVSYAAPLVLLMGSEREGLSANQAAACDDLLRLPMVGRVNSLNLAVATGVVLYEIFRQRQHTKHPPLPRTAARPSAIQAQPPSVPPSGRGDP